jgi:catechol 2,3-dioxygenase-like lactoylglutathione lyase family enzyme
MIDHIGIDVSNYETAKKFYLAALRPLGFELVMEVPREHTGGRGVAGFGVPPKPEFWISAGTADAPSAPAGKVHVAFRVESRRIVDAFHRAAIDAGGRDNGAPGIRAHYHSNYYGAFVLDPDGHNIEAVCHAPA